MFVLITFGLLLFSVILINGLSLSRKTTSFIWLTSALGVMLAWVSVLAWQFQLPSQYIPIHWAPVQLYTTSPQFQVDSYSWLFALSLTALGTAVILTAPARELRSQKPGALTGSLALLGLSLVTVLADNPLTLVLGWSAIDVAEFLITIPTSDSPALSTKIVVSLAIRAAGTYLMLWSSMLSASSNTSLLFEQAGAQNGIFLMIAAGLRLGVLPLHLTYQNDPMTRRGFGSILRLMQAATSLILLARLPAGILDEKLVPFFLLLAAAAAIFGAWMWLFSRNEISGRPYWIIGLSALALQTILSNNPQGAAAWSVAMILFGGISFLYSSQNVWLTRILAVAGILLLGLPFTLTGSAWTGSLPWPWLFYPLFGFANLMLVLGYVKHLFLSEKTSYSDLPIWAQSAYPVGLSIILLTILLVGTWGWAGAMQPGNWIVALVLLLLGSLVLFASWRFQRFVELEIPFPNFGTRSSFGFLLETFARAFWFFFLMLERLFDLFSSLLEGDGGLLWTLLLLVLFFLYFRGF